MKKINYIEESKKLNEDSIESILENASKSKEIKRPTTMHLNSKEYEKLEKLSKRYGNSISKTAATIIGKYLKEI